MNQPSISKSHYAGKARRSLEEPGTQEESKGGAWRRARRSQEDPGRNQEESQEESQEDPGRTQEGARRRARRTARKSQVDPKGARRSQGKPGRSQEEPGGEPGGARESQEKPGGAHGLPVTPSCFEAQLRLQGNYQFTKPSNDPHLQVCQCKVPILNL